MFELETIVNYVIRSAIKIHGHFLEVVFVGNVFQRIFN